MDKKYSEEEILKLKELALIIYEGNKKHERINRYEYYLMGGIPFKRAYKDLRRLYRENKLTIGEVNTINNYVDFELSLGVTRNKEFILKTYYSFGDRVLSDTEKESIWLSLNELGLRDQDIDDLVFSGAVRAYAKEKGLIPCKRLIKWREV